MIHLLKNLKGLQQKSHKWIWKLTWHVFDRNKEWWQESMLRNLQKLWPTVLSVWPQLWFRFYVAFSFFSSHHPAHSDVCQFQFHKLSSISIHISQTLSLSKRCHSPRCRDWPWWAGWRGCWGCCCRWRGACVRSSWWAPWSAAGRERADAARRGPARPTRPAWSPASGTAWPADSGSGGGGTLSSPGGFVPAAELDCTCFQLADWIREQLSRWEIARLVFTPQKQHWLSAFALGVAGLFAVDSAKGWSHSIHRNSWESLFPIISHSLCFVKHKLTLIKLSHVSHM